MLVLTRRKGQRIQFVLPDGSEAWMTIAQIDGRRGQVQLSFDAPAGLKIMREELLTRPKREPATPN